MTEYDLAGFVDILFSPFGGVSVVLAGLASYLGRLSATRISSREIAAQDRKLERLRANSRRDLERVKSELKVQLLRHDVLTSISKEKFQEMYDRRVFVYQKLLSLRMRSEDSFVENADYIHFHDEDPSYFVKTIEEVNAVTRENSLYISNELAEVSRKLYEVSSGVFADSKIKSMFVEMSHKDDFTKPLAVIEAENAELRRVFDECGKLYSKWVMQLDKDISEVRAVLDMTSGATSSVSVK